MRLSLEWALITLLSLSLMVLALKGPIGNLVQDLEVRRRRACLTKAVEAIDLAVTMTIGGGSASSEVYLPCEVRFEADGGILLSSGEESLMMEPPVRVRGSGVAAGRGRFMASWSSSAVELRWVPWSDH